MQDDCPEQFRIRAISAADAEPVGTFVSQLLTELYPELASEYEAERLIPAARDILENSRTTFGFLAFDRRDRPAGVIMLNECVAIYAHGRFGEITEVYVDARHRSAGIGARLIQIAIEFGRSRKWSMIEVGAPDVPRWQGTLAFYVRNGFREVGPRLYLPLT
jgi:GNAT superfamily N-acetyltransferase